MKNSAITNLGKIACAQCGILVDQNPNGRRKYCSSLCALRNWQHRNPTPKKPNGRFHPERFTRVGDYEINSVRFWALVGSDGLWTGFRSKDGYGMFGCKRNGAWVTKGAHRIAWMLKNGPIPEGMQVLHRNDTPACVDVTQLFLGTHADNMHDCAVKKRHFISKLRGEAITNSKLKNADVIEIRRLLSCGVPRREIARQFGVGHVHVWMIGKRRVWAHI